MSAGYSKEVLTGIGDGKFRNAQGQQQGWNHDKDNAVRLSGRTTGPNHLFINVTPGGKRVARLSLANHQSYPVGNDRVQETHYIPLTVWGNVLERKVRTLSGKMITIEDALKLCSQKIYVDGFLKVSPAYPGELDALDANGNVVGKAKVMIPAQVGIWVTNVSFPEGVREPGVTQHAQEIPQQPAEEEVPYEDLPF